LLTGELEREHTRTTNLLSEAEVLLNIFSKLEKKNDLPTSFYVKHRSKSEPCRVITRRKTKGPFFEVVPREDFRQTKSILGYGSPTQLYGFYGPDFDCLNRDYAVTKVDQADYKNQPFSLRGSFPNLELRAYLSEATDEWIVTIPIKLLNVLGLLPTKGKYKIQNKEAPELVKLQNFKGRILQIIFEATGQRFLDPHQALDQYFLYPPEKIILFGIPIDRSIVNWFIPFSFFVVSFVFWHRTKRLDIHNDSQNEIWVLLNPKGFLETNFARFYLIFLLLSPLAVGFMVIEISGGFEAAIEDPIIPLIFCSLTISEVLIYMSLKKIGWKIISFGFFNKSFFKIWMKRH
jgi:hypothetical protein